MPLPPSPSTPPASIMTNSAAEAAVADIPDPTTHVWLIAGKTVRIPIPGRQAHGSPAQVRPQIDTVPLAQNHHGAEHPQMKAMPRAPGTIPRPDRLPRLKTKFLRLLAEG